MKRKLFALLCIVAVLGSVFGIAAYAEEPENPAPTYTIKFEYASESTVKSGISYETYSDELVNESGFKILDELPIGHVIYDDPETSYIDGIRVNGGVVESLKVPLTDATEYVVVVRTVYAEGVLGDIARMSDGTYDWTKLLENPIILLQLVYWVLAIVSVIAGALISSNSKKTKAKTANEISEGVEGICKEYLEKMKHELTEVVISDATPILQKILYAFEDVIKAVTLSTSKSKEAPLALLDLLQHAANSTDVSSLIDSLRKVIEEQVDETAIERSANVETLRAIEARAATPAEAPKEGHASEPKSVF